MQQKRLVARLVCLQELTYGDYIAADGWNPNFIKTPSGRTIHRANVIATVISKPEQQGNVLSFWIDDATARMVVRVFENFEHYLSLPVGTAVNIIGRPREFSGERYIVPELVKIVQNPLWIQVRKKLMEHLPKPAPVDVTVEEKVPSADPLQEVLSVIDELDSGSGADTEDVVNKVGSQGEQAISKLIQEGEIFEFTPGKLKVLR